MERNLPTGTPTSPHIANLVFLKADQNLIKIADQYDLTYTRYVDDLTFSSQQNFSAVLNEILSIISDSGFKINYRKTIYKGKQTITGIVVHNNFIDGPIHILKIAKDEIKSRNLTKPYNNYLKTIRKTNNRRKLPQNPL